MSKIKEQLYVHCIEYIKKKEAEIRQTIADAQEAANDETKSSAGDKYESGRETIQQDIDMNLARLTELKNQKKILDQIMPAQLGHVVEPGSLVFTNNGNFYISISAGQAKVDGTTFYAISEASPIGMKMTGQVAGHQFTLNGKTFIIDKVF